MISLPLCVYANYIIHYCSTSGRIPASTGNNRIHGLGEKCFLLPGNADFDIVGGQLF